MIAESPLKEKVILVTGGTGTFGRTFVKRVLRAHAPAKLIIFSRDEWKQWEMRQSDPLFRDPRLRYFLGDVRDRDRLRRGFAEVDCIVHAAALKQVPTAEYNPSEFVQTNVQGAMNVIDAAIDCGVRQVVALSTDKAVNPVNLYGATKLCSDKLFVAGGVYVGARGYPRFSVVRYGNVLASRGSAIAFWQRLVKEGATELPITDRRMTRFWMTATQAVDFVISAFARMQKGGEIFIPKIPSMKLTDLAEAVAPGLALRNIGQREGEKLHELLMGPEDARRARELDELYVILPDTCEGHYFGERTLPDGFSYTSDNNSDWVSVAQLRQLLEERS